VRDIDLVVRAYGATTGAAMATVTKNASRNNPGAAVGWRKNRRPDAVFRTRRRSAATTVIARTAAPLNASQFQRFRRPPSPSLFPPHPDPWVRHGIQASAIRLPRTTIALVSSAAPVTTG